MDPEWKININRALRLLWVTFWAFVIIRFAQLAIPLLYPFLYGLIIALIINKPVHVLENKTRLPRWLSVAIVLLFFILLIFGSFTLVVTQVVIEITHLIAVLPTHIEDAAHYIKVFITREIIANFYANVQDYYSALDENYQVRIEEYIGVGLTKIARAGTFFINTLLQGLQTFLTSLPNAATVLVISLLAAFFISKDFYRFQERLLSIMPLFIQQRLSTVTNDLKQALVGFLRAQLTLISITGAIVIVGLLILQVNYAFTIGIITGIVDLLPLLGTGFIFVPWIIYLFFKGNFDLVIGLSILYGVVVIQRQIMEPKIVADSIGLDPLITLIALFVGLQLFGVVGLILGPVAVVVINALVKARVFQDLWNYVKGPAT